MPMTIYKACDKCEWESLGMPEDVDRAFATHVRAAHNADVKPVPRAEAVSG